MKLLLVEDDPKAVSFLKRGLGEEGFIVDACQDGQQGLDQALLGQYDLIILDIMLPGADGWTVLSELQRKRSTTPVLVLTARDAVQHRIKGFSLGADDYLVKPFAFGELLGRIRAVLRRNSGRSTETLQFEDLTLDPARGKAKRGDVAIELTPKEILLLELLMRQKEEVLSRTYIAERVWEMSFDSDSNVIDVNIRRLRAKVDDPFERKLIHTVRGRGYVLR
jgi:two-component system copper resistance phosphate regulon response regulator CusR